jgi:hypothetical protein
MLFSKEEIRANRHNSSSEVTIWYIEEYKKLFNKAPSCLGCDGVFETELQEFYHKKEAMENKANKNKATPVNVSNVTFKAREKNKIIYINEEPYLLDKLTDDKVIEFLKDKKGNKENRETLFEILPKGYEK